MTVALSDAEIEDRYYITGISPIIAMLGQLIYKSVLVTVQFNSGSDFILTTLLEARPEALFFDLGGDPQANKRLLEADTCTFIASVNGIRIQFATAGGVRQVRWGDSDVLSVRLPKRVLRLQRRDAYRITVPAAQSVSARLRYHRDGRACDEQWPVHDLSVSGLGLTLPNPSGHEPRMQIDDLTFELPEHREIECAGMICHVTEISGGARGPIYRMGLSFRDLPRPLEVRIQRYIIAVEHNRHKLAMESS